MRSLIGVLLLLLVGCAERESAWMVSATGIGPLQIGMTIAEAERAGGVRFDPADEGECVYRRTSAAPAGVLFMQIGERLVRIDVTAPGVQAAGGIEVGSSAATVQNTFGAKVSTSPHKYTDGNYLTVADDREHRLVFETDGQTVTRYRAGRLPEVEWVEGCS